MNTKPSQKDNQKESNTFTKVLYNIFVHNIGYKLLAIGTAVACLAITIALS